MIRSIKNIIEYLIITLVLVFTIRGSVFAQTAPSISLQPATTTVSPGSQVTVNVVLNAGTYHVSAVDLTVNYNTTQTSNMSISAGTFLPNVLIAGTASNGQAKIILGSGTTAVTGSGTIAVLTFTANSTTSLTIGTSTQVAATESSTNVLGATSGSTITVSTPVTVTPTRTPTPIPPSPTRTPTPTATRTPTPVPPTPTRTPTSVPPSPTRTPTPIVGSPTPTVAGIFFEAEQGTLTAPFTASSTYISQTVETTDPTQGGKATYSFTVPQTGNYLVTMKVNAPSIAYNSLFVNIDSEPTSPTMIWDISPTTSGFENRTVSWRGTGTETVNEIVPKPFNLTAGSHTLIVRGREANVQIDSITITLQSCNRKTQGDADCNGVVDGVDYSRWLNSQCVPGAGQTCASYTADFNGDGRVDDTDLSIWTANRV